MVYGFTLADGKTGAAITYRLGIDIRERSTDWVALGNKGGVESLLARGSVDSVVALINGELRAGSQVAAADPAGVKRVTTDFAQRLGDAKPIMVDGTPYGVESLIGHLVASVVTDARAKVGSEPGAVVLVHDDDLGDYRLGLWAEAGRLAGIPLVELTLLSRSEALVQSVVDSSGSASAAAGAAKIGWANHPELVGPASSGLSGGTVAGAAVGGAAVLGGGVIAATVIGGGEAIAAGPAVAAGPVGSALQAPAGPGGTALSGPGGTSLSGPGGTALSGPGGTALSGPVGTPLRRVVKAVKHSRRLQILSGGIVAATVGVVAVAAGGNDPPSPPRTSGTTVVVDVTNSAATDSTDVIGVIGVPPCTIGSWVMDNNSFAEMWFASVGGVGLGVTLESVTGSVSVDVNPNGEWTSTYTDWGFTSVSSLAGVTTSISISITGTDSSAGTFSPEGSFSFVTISVNTTVTSTLTSDGVSVPIPPIAGEGTAFAGTGTYECNDDTMTIQYAQTPTPIRMSRVV